MKIISLLLVCICLCGSALGEAANITETLTFHSSGSKAYGRLYDGKYRVPFETRAAKDSLLEITSPQDIYGLQIKWETAPGPWTLEQEVDGAWKSLGEYGQQDVLIEYVEVPGLRHLRLRRSTEKFKTFRVYELEAYGQGDLPSKVQRWKVEEDKADIMLLCAHPDDDIIFMGGLVPTYGESSGKKLQVAYMTYGMELRRYELLHALWHCGLQRYPVIGNFRDKYAKTAKQAYSYWKEEAALRYVVDLYRKYQPDVVVTHDVHGEYGHGAHKATADLAMKAYDLAADASYVTDYAPWKVSKLYLHLGDEADKITTMDWNVPMNAFGGKTSLDIAKEAWEFHESQRGGRMDYDGKTFFFQVTEGGDFDNAKFTLVRSTVGEDQIKNDFFEGMGMRME